jgi:calcineurin-like phosphoesterase family protein
MNVWFTSDQHFGHENIIEYCARPFKDAIEMDKAMIRRWNEVVDQDDIVWHLGDFTLKNTGPFLEYINELNGQIRIIPGGHDWRWLGPWAEMLSTGGWRIPGTKNTYLFPPLHSLIIDRPGPHDLPLVLCHYPMASWDRSHYGSIHLHGHVHNTWEFITGPSEDTLLPPNQKKGLRINMSVDIWNFYPVSFSHILDIAGISGTLRT